MVINKGLIELIRTALTSEPIPVSKLNQDTKGVLAGLAKDGKQRDPHAGPAGAALVTYRSEPEFLIVPIKGAPEYLQALAAHAAQQADLWGFEDQQDMADELDAAIHSAE